MKSLFWFRSDLRLADNTALNEAMQVSTQIIAVYILTPGTWHDHAEAPVKIQFILDNLRELSAQLQQRGIPLLIRQVPTFKACTKLLQNLCHEHAIDALYFNHEYPLNEKRRDQAVLQALQKDVAVYAHHDRIVLPPGDVLNQQGNPFKVFTPFKKQWLQLVTARQTWMKATPSRKKFKTTLKPDPIPASLKSFASPVSIAWQAGEAAATRRLKKFCQQHIERYQADRDIPSLDGGSQLSPYLTIGVLSPRQCITEVIKSCDLEFAQLYKCKGAETWVSELIWREFYNHIVDLFPEVCRYKPFRPQTDNLPWCDDVSLLKAWQAGQTGFPIVDAGMRQLKQTGWMHNRLRMIVAMFFSKILFLDWRFGEKYFHQQLIDGDFAANNGGWQWCASTGTDAVPYFRIFNPTTQSQRFDAQGEFIRRYCPELKSLDSKAIHDPLGHGIDPLTIGYVHPIVDYKMQREQTLSAFKAL